MNYELQLTSSNPYSFSTLNGSQPPLVAGSGSATLLTTNQDVNFPAYTKGYENTPFTLEVWFRPLTNTGELVVMGNATEGVIWNGTKFIIRIKQDAGTVETTWTPNDVKSFHLVLVYNPGQALFYVDSQLIASITLTASPFTSTTTAIRLNGGTGTGIYDSFAMYVRALSGTEISDHYAWGKSVRPPVQTATANGGSTWNLMHNESDIYTTERFDSSNWDLFFLNGVGIIGGLLTANEGGGTWMGMVPLSAMIGGVTAGVSLTYEGVAVVLSYSTDGSTWTPIANGAIILEDADVTNINLLVRIDLPDEGWVDHLSVSILNDRVLTPASGARDLSYKGAALDYESLAPLDYASGWGAVIRNNGYLRIEPGEDSVGTIEAWIKIDENLVSAGFNLSVLMEARNADNTSGQFVSYDNTGAISMSSGTALYVDGQLWAGGQSGAYNDGMFHHFVFVLGTTTTGRITVSGGNDNWYFDSTVGHLSVYPQKMTASEAQALYKSNVGAPLLRVNDTSEVTLTEQVTPVAFYAQNWSFVSSGS